MDSPVTFGEWLRQSRNELRLTREQFARRVGCSVSALRKIEDGERRPRARSLSCWQTVWISRPPGVRLLSK